ncbi:MAG TPA: Asp-tRNA(Asn)/Glu-tRNA(Gln) amidotransferase subunit GatC [Verrucomicrobiae bacterium]|nr:Asp-tRNA(Asn)/Glu-tRNA(Gln) amidotransferase subunit GatC [Verrucomicrobiae bacterium]
MTHISREEVSRLAYLSNIALTDSEIEHLKGQLEDILAYIRQLNELPTDNIEPTYQVTDATQATRADTIINYGLGRDELLANAPQAEAGQIKVPKVL